MVRHIGILRCYNGLLPFTELHPTPLDSRNGSTVAILGSGPALPSPAFAPDRLQRAPRVRVVVPGWRGPVPPGTAAMSRCRRTPRLAPPSGSSPETPLDERGWDSM